MESVIAVLIVVSVMVLSVYFANWTKDTSETKSQRDCEVLSVNSVGCGKKINAGVSRKQLTATVSFLNIKYC